jgi:acetoin utilization deacetylase AcuC-like enzyme
MIVVDALSRAHETGDHPERKERLDAIERGLAGADPLALGPRRSFAPATWDEVARIHDAGMLERSRALALAGGGWLDSDTRVSPRSWEAALGAAGAVAGAARAVAAGEARHALALVRPPGHHATSERAMGFCLVNNVAVAARAAQAAGLAKVAIVDIDVHHGNGTQEIFWEDPSVFYASLHRWPFYPGTGAADETGAGPGLGATWNAPLRHGTPPARWHDALGRALDAAGAFGPEIVIVSAGFDAYAEDPIGGLGLEVEDFRRAGASLRAFADARCGGRLVSSLEGGYHLGALGALVRAYVEGAAGTRA